MSKQFLGVIALIILIFIGIFTLSGGKTNAPGKSSNPKALTQHVIGQGKANVTLVEYGDYQCPFCGQYYPILKQVQTEFNDQIHFQFRNYPLTSLHANAFAGSRAAEAAGLQNKFWEMHDILYEQNELHQSNPSASTWINASDPIPYFTQYAKSLGLNTAQFKTDYASGKVNDLINADKAEGDRLGITGTPAFFLNGKKISIDESLPAFQKVIKEAIAKQPQTSSGTTSQTPAVAPAKASQ